MIVVIPMAGNGQRFTDAGYEIPKPLLPMPDGRTLIRNVVSSLPHADLIVTVSKPQLMLTDEMFRPHAWFPVNVKRDTCGPIDTILEARGLLKNDDELLIHYCDLFLPDNQCAEFVAEMREKERHAGVVCFPSHDPRFQREPSGRFAMSGIFYFRRASQFLKLAERNNRPDMSPGLLGFSITWLGLNMAAAFVTDNIVDLGVPDTYEMYNKLHKMKNAAPLFETTAEAFEDYLKLELPDTMPRNRMGWLMYKTLKQTVSDEETMELNAMIEAETNGGDNEIKG